MTVRPSVVAVGAVCLVLLGGLTCRRSKTSVAPPQRDLTGTRPSAIPQPTLTSVERIPMQTPDFEGPQAVSFSCEYASSLRNSQVLAKRKRFSTLERHVLHYTPADSWADVVRQAPFVLVVSPDGRHGALGDSRLGNDLLDDLGTCLRVHQGDVVALDSEVFVAGAAITWDGQLTTAQNAGAGMDRVATRRIDEHRFAVAAAYPHPPGDRPFRPSLGIVGGSRTRGSAGTDWSANVKGTGIAAIGADFTSVVALKDGRLQVYPPIPDAKGEAHLGAERNVGGAAKFISIVGPHILLIVPDPEASGGRLLAFTGDTTPVYSLTPPFEVLQPAIAGAKGRVYLAGKGLAALDHGKVTWAHTSDDPIYASTFEDGSLAVATGKRLDLVKTNGSVDQTFNAEEPLVAPPAIAADGSIWVASATALYIAR